MTQPTPPDVEAFFEASRSGDAARVSQLLAIWPQLVAARTPGSQETALHLAAGSGRLSVIETLIRAGAEVNAETATDETPLALALMLRQSAAAALLARHGGVEYP